MLGANIDRRMVIKVADKIVLKGVWTALAVYNAVAAIHTGRWDFAFAVFTTSFFAWCYCDAKYAST